MTEEDKIQASLVAFVRRVLPDALCYAVPNGGKRSKATGAKLKKTGVLAGVPDLAIVLPRKIIFAEVKTAKGRVSKEQRGFGMRVMSMGHAFAVWRSIDDARNTFNTLGVPTREPVASTSGGAQP